MKTVQMFPTRQEKVKERDWMLPWNTQLYSGITVFHLNCYVTLKNRVYKLRNEFDFLIICKGFDNFTEPNLQPYKKYLVTKYTAAKTPMRRQWK